MCLATGGGCGRASERRGACGGLDTQRPARCPLLRKALGLELGRAYTQIYPDPKLTPITPPKLGALGCGMRAILLSRKDFKRSAADEAAGRPPVDDARWREVATVHLTPYALLHLLRLTPHTLHNTPHASHLTPYASHLAPRTLRATCHPPPATYPLLTGARCVTCTRLRRCCASGERSNPLL